MESGIHRSWVHKPPFLLQGTEQDTRMQREKVDAWKRMDGVLLAAAVEDQKGGTLDTARARMLHQPIQAGKDTVHSARHKRHAHHIVASKALPTLQGLPKARHRQVDSGRHQAAPQSPPCDCYGCERIAPTTWLPFPAYLFSADVKRRYRIASSPRSMKSEYVW